MPLTQVQGGMLAGSTNTTTTIQSNGTTAITIDSSQNVGIGTSSPGSKLQVAGTVTASSNITISDSTLNTPRALVLSANRNSSGTLGTIRFGNTQFNNNEASIVAESDGALDAARITFNAAPTGGSLTERMRIASNGTITVSANASADQAMYLNNSSNNPYGIQCTFLGATPNNTTNTFFIGADSTNTKIYIYSSGTVTNRTGTYNAISDAKLKENIVDATPKLDKLMGVKVRNYNLIGDDLKQIGFVAQELETVFPNLIDNVPDLDENKQPTGEITKGVKLTVMIPILVKAIQELKAELDATKAEVAALKAAP